MDIKFKERLIGVMVLVSLAIIFLPSLFHSDQRVEVDRTTLIPAKPIIEPIVIQQPQKSAFKPAPLPEKAFQPLVEDALTAKAAASDIPPVTKTLKSQLKPALDEKGLPKAWVVQLGSFKSQKRANELREKLLLKSYKAYSRPIHTSKGKFYRVFVGPYIETAHAQSEKKRLDKIYNVSSQILRFSPE